MSGGLWSITLVLPYKPAEADRQQLEMALEPFGEALSSFEIDDGKAWKIEVFGESEPDAGLVRAALRPLGDFTVEIAPVPEKDWVAESQRGLPALTAGPFFIHGSHHQDRLPKNKIVFEDMYEFTIKLDISYYNYKKARTDLTIKSILFYIF